MAQIVDRFGGGGGGWKEFSQTSPKQVELEESQAAASNPDSFSEWPKERQDAYINSRKAVLTIMEKFNVPLSPYFQTFKEGIESIDKGEKTWDQLYRELEENDDKSRGRERTGKKLTPEAVRESKWQGIDVSGIKDGDSLEAQEVSCGR